MKKKYLIIGAAGFIGSHLLKKMKKRRLFVKGIDNYAFSKKGNSLTIKKDIYNCDILNQKKICKIIKNFNTIIHLAGVDSRSYFVKNFERSNHINIKGTENIIKCLTKNQRLIFLSSNMVYGDAIYSLVNEKHPTNANEPYAISKLVCESLIKSYSFVNKFKYTIIRNFNTYGPGQSNASMIPTLILDGIYRKKIEVWSPETIRDFQYIDDCVDGIISVVKSVNLNGQIVNLASGKNKTMRDVVSIICELLGAKKIILNKPKPISNKIRAEIKKIKKYTGWRPKINFLDGIKKTIIYYSN